MTRLLIAAVLFSLAAVPAFACAWNTSAATDTAPSTVASQPADQQTAPPPAPVEQKPG